MEEIGEVAGKRLVHLQCHFGLDTISWGRRGATVTGLDFSQPAVEAATRLAAEVGIQADFVAGDVYDARALLDRRFDIVYTGLGALNWLPDIGRWAEVVASLLDRGGIVYLAEFHPLTFALADESLEFERDYFHDPEGVVFDEPGTYADLAAKTTHDVTREWNHPIADVVSALVAAGLRLELFHEHDYTLFARWPWLERAGGLQAGEIYRTPAGTPRIPLMYSLRARRDA